MNRALSLLVLALAGCADRPINPGAVTEVYESANPAWMAESVTGTSAKAHGLTVSQGPVTRIYVADRFDGVTAHEITHYYEHRLMLAGDYAGAKAVRHAFRDLCSADYEIGNADLLKEIP